MFSPDKQLPAPPIPEKPWAKASKSSSGSSGPGALVNGTNSGRRRALVADNEKTNYNSAKSVFEAIKLPCVQRQIIAAAKNPIVQKMAISAAKNEQVQRAVIRSVQNEFAAQSTSGKVQKWDESVRVPDKKSQDPKSSNTFSELVQPNSLADFGFSGSCSQSENTKVTQMRTHSQNVSHPQIESSQTSSTNSLLLSQTSEGGEETHAHGIAQYDFSASHFDELSAKVGDTIVLEKMVDSQWVYGSNKRTVQKGIFPLVFLDVKVPLNNESPSHKHLSPFYVRAMYDYDSGVAGDLKFHANDEIYVVEEIDEQWLRGYLGDKVGILPSNYVMKKEAESSGQNVTVANIQEVYALYDYNSDTVDDLRFNAGDRIEVIEWLNSDWLRGRLHGMIGMVPRTYIAESSNIAAAESSTNANLTVVATTDYFNASSQHLCFSKGDKIEILQEIDTNWLRGKLLLDMSNTKCLPVGIFPRSAIQ